jgi:RNA polymerase-binding transcription factor DksA
VDDIDCAAERVEAFREVALRVVLDRLSGPRSSGICQSCFETIEPERIELIPSARHCSYCAAEEEASFRLTQRRGHRRPGKG